MIFNLFHFIFGCVYFTATDVFAERFINMCTAEGIPLWKIRRKSGGLSACTTIDGYRKIKKSARISGMRVRIKRKSGLPFVINKYESHTGLFVGIVAVILILTVLSNHIWVVRVNGNEMVDDEVIEEVFSRAGLKIGVRKNKFDASDINSDAVLGIPELSWASINVDGCVAEIEVREAMRRPSVEKTYGTSNIVASKDGQIEIIEPYRGSAAIKNGQTVMEGGLLISGVSRVKSGASVFNDADGYVVARTSISVTAPIEKNITVMKPRIRTVRAIYFLGKEIRFGKRRNSDMEYLHKSWLNIQGVKMPFGIYYSRYTDFDMEEKNIGKEYAELAAINNLAVKSYHETLHTQIFSQKVTMQEKCVYGEYGCFENICRRVPFETEETEEEQIEQ